MPVTMLAHIFKVVAMHRLSRLQCRVNHLLPQAIHLLPRFSNLHPRASCLWGKAVATMRENTTVSMP